MHNINNITIELTEIDLNSNSILKISIDKKWTAGDFNELFHNIDIIYRSKFLIYQALFESKNFILKQTTEKISFKEFAHTPLAHILETIKNNLASIEQGRKIGSLESFPKFYSRRSVIDELIVKRVRYSSPGITDFLGIAGILKEIKETLMYYFPNQNDKEKSEIIKQQKIELQIKNLKAIGFSDIEIRSIILKEDIKLQKISEFIEQGLISKVEIKENKN